MAVTDGGEKNDGDGGYLADFREGLRYLRGTFFAILMGGSLVINFSLGTMNSTMPAYADGVGGPEAYRILLAALSIGVFVGAAGPSWFERFPFGHLSIVGFLFSGLAWVTAIWIGWLPATAVPLALAGGRLGRRTSSSTRWSRRSLPIDCWDAFPPCLAASPQS
ncbi:MAG: hypothetical protein ACI9PP_001097 [Halobacteriales archaeon]|jgi:hypothetical protein